VVGRLTVVAAVIAAMRRRPVGSVTIAPVIVTAAGLARGRSGGSPERDHQDRDRGEKA
jgi:hypothetical protein